MGLLHSGLFLFKPLAAASSLSANHAKRRRERKQRFAFARVALQ
jgi:hypothetical protein